MSDLKHGKTIAHIYNLFFEDWMSDKDKAEVIRLLGMDEQEMDKQIQQGIDNGYSADMQIALVTSLYDDNKPPSQLETPRLPTTPVGGTEDH